MALEGRRVDWQAAALHFLGRLVEGHTDEWEEYSLGRRGLEVCIPWFSFQLHLPEGVGFLSLFCLDRNCHEVGPEWELVTCRANKKQVTLGHWRFMQFPTFLCLLPRPLSPQNVWFPVILEVAALLCLPMEPHFLQVVWFPATWPVAPFSLLTCNYLSALTVTGWCSGTLIH